MKVARLTALVLALGALALSCSPKDGDEIPPFAQPDLVTMRVALRWNGLNVTRLHVELLPQAIRDAEPTVLDINEPIVDGSDYVLEVDLLPGSWRLDVTAYDGAQIVAQGSVVFEASGGEVNVVELTLDPWEGGDNELAHVQVVLRMCPASPITSVIAYQEELDPEGAGRPAPHLVVVATLVPGAAPDDLTALIRWGRDVAPGEAQVALSPRVDTPSVWEGVFEMVEPELKHTVEVTIDGMELCGDDGGGGDFWDPENNPLASVWVGDGRHTCGLRLDGRAHCWGNNDFGQASPPADGRFVKLALGWEFTCGLQEDGEVLCWGNDDQAQAAVPAGTYLDIAAHDATACGIRTTDAAVLCWGNVARMHSNMPVVNLWGPPAPAATLDISWWEHLNDWWTGGGWGCYITPAAHERTLHCFGPGDPDSPAMIEHEFGEDPEPWEEIFVHFPDGFVTDVQAVATGDSHGCWLAADGTLGCYGFGPGASLVPGEADYASVGCGMRYCCAERQDRTVQCWGSDDWDLGVLAPTVGNSQQMTVGRHHACSLQEDNGVVCWGRNDFGQAPHDPMY